MTTWLRRAESCRRCGRQVMHMHLTAQHHDALGNLRHTAGVGSHGDRIDDRCTWQPVSASGPDLNQPFDTHTDTDSGYSHAQTLLGLL